MCKTPVQFTSDIDKELQILKWKSQSFPFSRTWKQFEEKQK